MPKQAVILAAGGGGRTRPFTANRPKSMLFIAGKPLLQHIIEALSQNGIRDIVLVVGHRKERIFDFLGSGSALGVNMTYVTQAQQLGSADALAQAQPFAGDDFLVLPGDKYIRAETLSSVIRTSDSAMLVKRGIDPPRSSIVTIHDGKIDNCILSERRAVPTLVEKGIFTIDTRIYALDRHVFAFLEGAPSIYSALCKMIDKGSSVAAVETQGEWADLLYPWDILSVNEAALKHIQTNTSGTVASYVSLRGEVNVSGGVSLNANSFISGPVFIGTGCRIGPHAAISGPVSIGANTNIDSFACISNCVIGSNVHIAPGAIIQDSVIDDGTVIGPRFTVASGEADIRIGDDYHHHKIGVMIGEGCQLGAGIITKPGTIIGNFCHVEDLKVLSGGIPDKSMAV